MPIETYRRSNRWGQQILHSIIQMCACELILAGCDNQGDKSSGALSSIVGSTVASATTTDQAPETLYLMKTAPYSTCTVHLPDDTTDRRHLHAYANWQGYVRFYGRGSELANLGLVLDCHTDDGQTLGSQWIDGSALPQQGKVADSLAMPPGTEVVPALAGDPMAPSQEKLLSGGYPFRPDPSQAPDSYAQWLRSVSKPMTLLPARAITDPTGGAQTLWTQPTWAGVALKKTTPATVYGTTYGYFYQPSVLSHGYYPTGASQAINYFFAGMDGAATSSAADVVQAGTQAEVDVVVMNGVQYPTQSYWAFAEWYPDSPNVLPDVPVQPGNYYYTVVWMSDSTGSGLQPNGYMWFLFAQEDEGPGIRACIGPPGSSCMKRISHNQVFVGDSAEWILENATPNNILGNFGTTQMQYANAFRIDEGDHVLHCDGGQDFDSYGIVKNGTTSQASATNAGATSTYGLVNYTWTSY